MEIKFKGIIFDIDGTLTSTNELIFATFNHIAGRYLNKKFTNEEITALFGPTEDVILKEMCGDQFDNAKKDYYSFYTENHSMADLYPGIKNILEFLTNKGVLLSIYTGKGRKAAVITLKKLGIHKFFNLIVSGDDVKEHKPSAEGISVFLTKYNLSKNEVLMIGDAPSDIKASRSAGIKVASVLWDNYAKKEEVLKLNSDFVFYSVEELEKFLMEKV
ncbi:MAG: HAD family hydrolase [Ignavibacteriaceae bacterium]|nr:HAD family hydrolase [Ignavibacteriaceae bacterium]